VKIYYSDDHHLHFPKGEIYGGEFVVPFERPARMDYVLDRLKKVGMTDISGPGDIDMGPVNKIHDAGFLSFLETAYDDWKAAGFGGDVIAVSYPARRMQQRVPTYIDGKAGYYCLAMETSIAQGTWKAAVSSCAVAQAAQKAVAAAKG